MDELHLEELSSRIAQEKMDDAFRIAMQRAIDAGEEKTVRRQNISDIRFGKLRECLAHLV